MENQFNQLLNTTLVSSCWGVDGKPIQPTPQQEETKVVLPPKKEIVIKEENPMIAFYIIIILILVAILIAFIGLYVVPRMI